MSRNPSYLDKYSLGLQNLRNLLKEMQVDNMEAELAVLESRLVENIEEERLYGASERTRATRARIIHDLDRFTQEHLHIAFMEL